MAEDSPAGSPLSTLSSDAFEPDEEQERNMETAPMPPAKRQKLGESAMEYAPNSAFDYTLESMSISSDSEGEVPNSPSNRPDDDEVHEQVTVCTWIGCEDGDMGNMDKLVEHIHDKHIETRGKKYTCEWSDCNRRGMQHASAYALKAHMRSHTREKPFYCTLPECDRAFTRSDALAKHHRTVHETEALRPSDPVPKSMQANKFSRLKLNLKIPQIQEEGQPPEPMNGASNAPPGWTSSFSPELGFTSDEEARGAKGLYRLLRRQLKWAEEEAETLKRSSKTLEDIRKKEWKEKEILITQALQIEADYQARRMLVISGSAQLPTAEEIKAAAGRAWGQAISPQPGSSPSRAPMAGVGPMEGNSMEAAVALASMGGYQ